MRWAIPYLVMGGLCLPCSMAMGQEEPDPDSIELETLVVTGSRTEHALEDSPVPVEVITREDIEQSGGESVADVLDGQIGVNVQHSFQGATVQLQGLDSKYVLVLVDGERIGGRISGAIDLSRLYVENIQRIEIVKGASCALYGSDAMGGVINIITRKSDAPFEGNARVHYGSGLLSESAPPLHAMDVSGGIGFREGDWNTRFHGGWHSIDSFDLDPATPGTTGSAVNQWEVGNKTSYAFTKKNRVHSSLSYSMRDQQAVDSNETGAVFDRRNLIEYLRASVGPEFSVGDGGTMKIQGTYHLNRDQYIYDQRNSAVQDKDEESIEHLSEFTAQYSQLLGDEHLLITGVDGLYQRIYTPRLDGGQGDRIRLAVFAQDEWTPTEEPLVQVVPGVRLDMDSQFGLHVSPKASLRYDPIESLVLRASYGMGYRAPDFKELFLRFENPGANYVVIGNQNLKPETSHSVNLGLQYSPVDWFEGALNLYRNDISDLIDAQSISPGGEGQVQQFSYVNIAEAYTQGLEAQLGFHFATYWTLEPGYTLTDTRDKETQRELDGRSLHRAHLEARFNQRDWGLRISSRGTFVGPRIFYYVQPEPDEMVTKVVTDPHVLLDLRIAQELGEFVSLTLQGENLLDEGNVEHLPIQPRTVSVGLMGSF